MLADRRLSSGTVFKDVVTLALLAMVSLVIILLIHVNPPTDGQKKSIDSPGRLIVQTFWPKESPADVDLYLLAPGDSVVSYQNKSGLVFDLLRDDLGHSGDPTPVNSEIAFTRGLPAGEYIIGVRLYKPEYGKSTSVQVHVRLRSDSGATTTEVYSRNLVLQHLHEEKTAVRFMIDSEGRVVPGSINLTQKLLAYRGSNRGS